MAEKYLVEGYEFDNIEDANEAKKELEAVKYMSRRTDGCSVQEAYLIYNKIVEGNLFKTAIGFDYLRALEEFLMENGMFDVPQVEEDNYSKSSYDSENEAASLLYNQPEEEKESPKEIKKKEKEAKKAERLAKKEAQKEEKKAKLEERKAKKAANKAKEVVTEEIKLPDMIAEQPKEIKPEQIIELEKKLKSSQDKLKTSILFNVILAIGIAVMMYIASTSSNVNILNYETALQDKYSSWAEELKQKEETLKEWEKSLEEQSKGQN